MTQCRPPAGTAAARGGRDPLPLPVTTGPAAIVTGAIVGLPVAGIVVAAVGLVGRGIHAHEYAMAAVLYVISGFGISAGFHRLLTHPAYRANAWLRGTLTVAGVLAWQGSPLSWAAQHRRHHAFTDRPGDPHSPWAPADPAGAVGPRSSWRSLLHAHCGWLFRASDAQTRRWVPDLHADPVVAAISKIWPLLAAVGLVVPFLVGWVVTGTLAGAFWGLVWGGLVRVFVLHHVTWSVNSICHIWGRRPFGDRDESRNVAWLALPSFGESWHNAHHAFPNIARHGVLPHQWDPTAAVIRGFERLGWATDVRWPTPRLLESAAPGYPRP